MSFIAMTTGYTFSITEKNNMERLYGIFRPQSELWLADMYLFYNGCSLAFSIFNCTALWC